jgi:hypothetical protein
MKRSLYLLALSMPLMLGAAPPPMRPIPQGELSDVVQVNVIDRFLQDAGVRKRPTSSQRSRSRSQASRNAIPKPPALAIVPLPIPKPTAEGAQATSEKTPATEQAQRASPAAPRPEEKPAPAETAKPEATVEKQAEPKTEPPETAKPETATPQEAAKPEEPNSPPATQAAADDAAKPPVVEQPATATEPAHQAEVPKPLAKPETDDTTAGDKEPAKDQPKEGQTAEGEVKPDGKKSEEGEKAEAEPPPPPLVAEDPQELQACLADLKAIGAKFEATDPINEGNGCGIEHPIDVAEVLPGVDLGGATMRCKTALTMAHWLKDTAQPALNIAMPGRKIVRLVPGSTYQCRLRNNASTGKISEHARGNAFDVAAFKLDNGETITMKPRDEDSTLEGAFQRTATAGACLHFTTVLSPGSDAAHEDHLHLDVLERKNGYRYCR